MTPETAAIATNSVPVITQGMVILLGLLMVRDMVWKGIGLWKA